MRPRRHTRTQKVERLPLYETAEYREILDRIGGNVLRLRTKAKLSQEAAADRCDLTTRMLGRIERGEANLTVVTLSKLVRGLEADISELTRRMRKGDS